MYFIPMLFIPCLGSFLVKFNSLFVIRLKLRNKNQVVMLSLTVMNTVSYYNAFVVEKL